MTVWKGIGFALLLLLLIGLVRVGGIAEYGVQGFQVWLRAGLFRFRLVPGRGKGEVKPEPKREKKKVWGKGGKKAGGKKKKPGKGTEQRERKGGPLQPVRRYLPLAVEAAGELRRRIRIDRLELDFISGGGEAAGAAMALGRVNVALGMLWPLIDHHFEVREHRIRTGVDFDAQSPAVYVNAAFSARIGQLVSVTLRFGFKFFKLYFRDKKEKSRPKM